MACNCPALGDDKLPVDTRKQAERSLKSMKRSLERWLDVRARVDAYAAGRGSVPLLRRLGKAPLPPPVVRATLTRERFEDEQTLATTVRELLLELGFDAAKLPSADVRFDPEAAVKLARIAVAGKVSDEVGEAPSPQAQGLVWFVLAIPILGVVLVLTQLIKSNADVAVAKEEIRCIQSGACSDTKPYLIAAGIIGGFYVGRWIWREFEISDRVKDALSLQPLPKARLVTR